MERGNREQKLVRRGADFRESRAGKSAICLWLAFSLMGNLGGRCPAWIRLTFLLDTSERIQALLLR